MEELFKTGKTVKYGPGHPIDYAQFPSYVLSELIGTEPVQLQNFIEWKMG